MSLFKTKKQKQLENFINSIEATPLFLLEELKDRFPIEISWFMSPITINGDSRIKDVILSIAVVYGSITEAIPTKVEENIRKELSKKFSEAEIYSQDFLNWLIEHDKEFLATNPTPSRQEYNEFLYMATGDYLCFQVEGIHQYNDEIYKFTDKFAYEVGFILINCFNEVLKEFL